MIVVKNNTSSSVTFSSPTEGGIQMTPTPPATETAVSLSVDPDTYMTKLGDVEPEGLDHNDVLVYDQVTGKFKPVDAEVINNNDGGTW